MHLGKKLAAILMGSMLAAAAGCADGDLTGPRVAPDTPSYDGSGWAGSGNRTESDSSTTISSGGSGWAGSGNFTAADSATTDGRGSGWAGSGN